MKKLNILAFFLFLFNVFNLGVFAEGLEQDKLNIKENYYVVDVIDVLIEEKFEEAGMINYYQKLLLQKTGEGNQAFEFDNFMSEIDYEAFKVDKGEKIIIKELVDVDNNETQLEYFEKYRSPSLQIILIVFLVLVVFLARGKGILSILGLIFSLAVVTQYMIPAISNGGDPFIVCLIATFIAGPISIFFAHGFDKNALISVISTMVIMFLAVFIATVLVEYAQVFGIGHEDSYFLQVDKVGINIKGLFLGGIIVGILGILDDITTAQTAAVAEIKKANKKLGFFELYKSALNIGKEHMASVVNTLIMAYAGVSFPLLLLLTSSSNTMPLWVQLNLSNISEEIVRALSGSIVLVVAVPITTAIAAFFLSRKTFLDRIYKND